MFVCGCAWHAQAPLAAVNPDTPTPFIEPSTPVAVTPPTAGTEHPILGQTEFRVIRLAAALNTADFSITRANLQSGGQELNPVVRVFGRSSPGLAVNFIGETMGGVSLSYFFHKTGHHKLERAVSMLDIGSTAGAVSYDLMHR